MQVEKTSLKEIFLLSGITLAVIIVVGIYLKNKKDENSEETQALKLDEFWKKNISDGNEIISTWVKKNNLKDFTPYLSMYFKQFGILAKELKTSEGYFEDDEEKVYSFFRQIPTILEMYVFNRYFTSMYKIDILSFINSFMNEAEKAEVYRILKDKKFAVKFK